MGRWALSPSGVPSIRSVMQKYLEDRGEVTFDKIFAQKIGELGALGDLRVHPRTWGRCSCAQGGCTGGSSHAGSAHSLPCSPEGRLWGQAGWRWQRPPPAVPCPVTSPQR